MTAFDRSTSQPHRSRRSAGGVLLVALVAVVCTLLASTLPASAARGRPGKPTTTTTTKATTTTAPTSTTTTTTTPPPPPCGGSLPKATGGTWECSFADEFDTTTLDRTKWVPQQTLWSGFTTGVECFMDDPDNVSVSGGTLNLTVRKEASPVSCGKVTNTTYTAGMVSTFMKWSQAFGRFEIRAKFPSVSVKGLQGALWLWPDEAARYGPWPYSGEIDIAEVYSIGTDRAIPFVHYATDGVDFSVTNNYCLLDATQFHTYVAEWTETSLRILYDGKVCLDHTWNPAAPLVAPEPFSHPFMIGLTQGLGQAKNAFDPATTPLPATMQIDYVRVWK